MKRQPNAEQLRVIEQLDNNFIVFASAGTGKTFTVANRVSHIIKAGRALPSRILCLTFTIKACEEMREDVARYVGDRAQNVEIRTIHSFCYAMMREENRRRGDRHLDATVCDEEDTESLLRSILSSQFPLWERGLPAEEGETFNVQFDVCQNKKTALREFISVLKHAREEWKLYSENEEADYQKTFDRLRSEKPKIYEKILSSSTKRGEQVRDEAFERGMTRFAGRLAFTYEDYLKKSNRVDFDNLLIFVSRYLEEEAVLQRWSNRYDYIIVDEMQDTSDLEYSILKRIFGKNNVMMCGDFFQSIYEWRGARPTYILEDFIQRFSATTYTLSENYRSTRALTAATFGYLKNSYPSLIEKYGVTDLKVKSAEEGEKILLFGFDNRKEEAYRIFRYLQKAKAQADTKLCVMARTNSYLSSLLYYFEEYNEEYPKEERLRFFTSEENSQFYKKTVIKDVLAVLKLLFNPFDRVSMERLTQTYVRLVGSKSIEQIRLKNQIGVSIVSFLDKQVYEHADPYHVLIESFQKGDIIVYDTETTGLNLQSDQMVQLSAIRMDREGNILDTFDQMIEPTIPIGEEAYRTHGFDLEYIKTHGGVSAKEALVAFSNFVRGATLVGHNSMRFDRPLLQRQLKENGLPPLDVLAEYDTLIIAKEFHAQLPDFRLSTLCFKYDIVNEAAHNAYGDIVATGKVLHRMLVEDIIPSALERRNVCEKYRDKFEKLYLFFADLSERIKTSSAKELIHYVLEEMRIRQRYKGVGEQHALDILCGTFQHSKEGAAEEELYEYLSNAELSLRTDVYIERQNAIPLLTVHQSKGCEFDTVILAGVDDQNFPSRFAKGDFAEEEEKKVFYVAITRAKKKLIVTRSAYKGEQPLFPSPFVGKIPNEYLWKNERWDAND